MMSASQPHHGSGPSGPAAARRSLPSLPVENAADDVLRACRGPGHFVVTAPTGSGKSTRIPQILADGLPGTGRILVLQPRRLACRMLAERVAWERGGSPGEEVGFQTRYERVRGRTTRILYLTEGLLLRWMLADPTLDGTRAVLLDEFHERSLDADVSLALLRRLRRATRPDLILGVMSATLEAQPVCDYLGGAPHIHAEGRTYPVDIVYQPGKRRSDVWDTAAEAVNGIVGSGVDGDILVFMPGVYEIRRTVQAIRRLRGVGSLSVCSLYGTLSGKEQRQTMAPTAQRKVIVATNIAETSLTIPGVRHVVDSGLARISRHDAGRGINMLETRPISRASADQRAGRAGRETPGTCTRLWTELEQQHKDPRTSPEIARVDLTQVFLFLKACGMTDSKGFPWFEPPPPASRAAAIDTLRMLGALAPDGGLMPRGRELATIPAHPRLACLMLEGAKAGVMEEAAGAAALFSERPVVRSDAKLQRRGAAGAGDCPASDVLLLLDLVMQAGRSRFAGDVCRRLGVRAGAARDVWRARRHFLDSASRGGVRSQGRGGPEAVLKAILAAFPDRLACRRDRGTLLCRMRGGRFGELVRNSSVRGERLLVVGEIRETADRRGRSRPLLSLASGVREEWLMELFPEAWEDTDELVWCESRKQVRRRRRTACLGVVLEESERDDVDPDAAGNMLADLVLAGKLDLKGWNAAVDNWILRVRWLAGLFPERDLLAYDVTDREVIIREICARERRYKDVRDRPCLDHVKHALDWHDVQFVERMAPERLQLPSGRRLRITYEVDRPPTARAFIQDLYGLTETPGIAGGRTRLLLDILAPNRRTVQITDDLSRFWREHYPAIRRELSRRYHKHEWKPVDEVCPDA